MNKTNLVFLDTETTGAGNEDRLCQVAFKFQETEVEALFKPPLPISVDAMAIAHITNKMVENCESFETSAMKQDLQQIFAEGNILVAHNAKFDVEMLKREGMEIKNVIDTYKVAMHLDADGKVPKYNLQYLRYFFGLEIENVIAHDALGDVRVLEAIFWHYYEEMFSKIGDEEKVLQEMLEISAKPILLKKFNFGKYADAMVAEVAANDPGYLKWLLNEKIKVRDQGGDNDENWIYTLQHYLGTASNQMRIL
jgi:DNA polymerase III epsilon subunit-like protein